MADRTLELTLLYDFFGELLTPTQREYFDLHYNEDLSLAEIAENAGVSRQAVRDAIVKAEKAMRGMEEKTGVVARFTALERRLDELTKEAESLARRLPEGEERAEAMRLAAAIKGLKD